ncbi:hypothetical protein G6F43_010589 [Rhizopus delemar]|nr:hypothetical protein G6F43_010589 [Rhizopus delemar]
MRFPRDVPANYTIPQVTRDYLKLQSFVLIASLSSMMNIENHISALPTNIMLGNEASQVYSTIKDSLFKVCDCSENQFALPKTINSFMRTVQSYFTLNKSKKKFIQIYNAELIVLKRQNKVSESRKRTYEQAQLLGSDLTNQSIQEFRAEFITQPFLDKTTDNTASEGTSRTDNVNADTVNGDTPNADTIIDNANINTTDTVFSIVTDSAFKVQGMDKETVLQKKQKMFTIYNPAAYLTTPHKPKIQVIDQHKIKDICAIGMEFLENKSDLNNAEEMTEYRSNVVSQAEFKSLKEFPHVIEFIKECLDSDMNSLPCFAWSHPIHSSSTGLTKKFARVIALSLADFTSNCKQHSLLIGNHERTAFVKYLTPPLKYLSQETGNTIMSWCEKQVECQVTAGLEPNNYQSAACEFKFADGHGVNMKTNDEELFIESSSGINKESVSHTLEDTIKIIVESSNALNCIVKKNKNASIGTICKKEVYGIQLIVRTLTLMKLSLKRSTCKWKAVEVRSSPLPVDWNARFAWLPMFELMATLLLAQVEQEKVNNLLIQESTGYTKLTSEKVSSYLSQYV